MSGDRVAGMLITVGYTFGLIMAIQPDASGGLQDLATWSAWLLLILAVSLYALPDNSVLELAGGDSEAVVRGAAIIIQLCALWFVGWWWTFVARAAAEVVSFHRVRVARQSRKLGFKVDQDHLGQFFIHCYECGRNSYNRNDIEKLYCGCCNKFHHGNDHQQLPIS